MAASEAEAQYVAKLEGALRYIASPTLGRPGDTDAAEFVRQGGGSEHAIRTALAYCITLAQQVLDPEHNDGSSCFSSEGICPQHGVTHIDGNVS